MMALRCFAVSLLLLALPAVTAAEHNDLMKEVEAIGDKIAKAMAEDDVDTMLSMYVDDAISLPNYGPRMEGVDTFRKQHEQMTAAGMKVLSFESDPTDVWECADQVIEIGNYEISIQMPGMPEPVDDKGKYVTIYNRQADGSLKVKVETWNTDHNPMEMMGSMPGGEHGHGHGHGGHGHGGHGHGDDHEH